MFLNRDFQYPLAILLYDLISGHTESVIHKVVHMSWDRTETAADVRKSESEMGVPISLRKEGGNGFEFFHTHVLSSGSHSSGFLPEALRQSRQEAQEKASIFILSAVKHVDFFFF